MRIIDSYIRKQVIGSTAIVVLILMAVEGLLEFISQLSDIGTEQYGLVQALKYVAMQLPADLYQLFPMAGFLGCLLGLGKLASTSQLTVLRAAGISKMRVAWTVIKAATLMMILVTLVGEVIAPHLQSNAQVNKTLALKKATGLSSMQDIWLRNGEEYVHFSKVISNKMVENATLFVIDAKHRLKLEAFSPLAYYSGGAWYMKNAIATLFDPQQLTQARYPKLKLNVILNITELQAGDKSAEQQSIKGLLRTIRYQAHAGLMTVQYRFSLWQRIIQPITAIVMICLGVPFIFGSLRKATMGSRILMGVMVGFGFYLLSQLFGPIAMLYQIPPMLAAITPTVIFAIGCVILLRKTA